MPTTRLRKSGGSLVMTIRQARKQLALVVI